jgi:hypothetical protein
VPVSEPESAPLASPEHTGSTSLTLQSGESPPKKVRLPKVAVLRVLPEQLKQPLFVAIARVLLVYGNDWQSATDLVGTRLKCQLVIASAVTNAHAC